MLSLSSLRLGPRLAVGFGAIVLLVAAAVGFGIDRIRTVHDLADRLGTTDAEKLSMSERWGRAIEANAARTWVMFYATDAEVKTRVKAEMQAVVAAQTERLKRMVVIATSDEDKRLLADITTQRNAYQSMRNDLLKRKEAGEDVTAEVLSKLFPAAEAYNGAVEKLIVRQRESMAEIARFHGRKPEGVEDMRGLGEDLVGAKRRTGAHFTQ